MRLTKDTRHTDWNYSKYTAALPGGHIAYIAGRKGDAWTSMNWKLVVKKDGEDVFSPYLGFGTTLNDIRAMLDGWHIHWTGDPNTTHNAWKDAKDAAYVKQLQEQIAYDDAYKAAKAAYFRTVLAEIVGQDAAEKLIADPRIDVALSRYTTVPGFH